MKQITVYNFSELSEKSKQKAVKNYRNNQTDYFDAEGVISDFSNICDILGVTLEIKNPVSYQIDYSQSDFALFRGGYRHKKDAPSKIEEYAPNCIALHNIAKQLLYWQRKHLYNITCSIGEGYRRNSIQVDNIELSDGVNLSDDCYLELESEFNDIFKELAHYLYNQLLKFYDYTQSDDYIIEFLETNDYQFLENGKML